MNKRHARKIDHETCIAYFRGALPLEYATEIRAYLDEHPETARLAKADADYERAIAEPLDGVLREALPARLQIRKTSPAKSWSNGLALATVVAVSVAAGWGLGQTPWAVGGKAAFAERVVAAAQQPLVQPVGAQRNDVIKTPPPDMSLQGYQLVQQRQLNGGQSALVEFVYRNHDGYSLRIYAETGVGHHTVPTVTTHDGMAIAQWRNGDTRYALVSKVPETSLQTLAQAAQANASGGANKLADAKPVQPAQSTTSNDAMVVHPSTSLGDKIIPAPVSNSYATQPASM